CEAFLSFGSGALLPLNLGVNIVAGFGIGLSVGIVSSVLGVAGGELLIPSLMLVFGAGIKEAGSVSILISLGIVLKWLWRYWRADAVPTWQGARRITTAMAAGSIIGATIGGLGVAYAPVSSPKAGMLCYQLRRGSRRAGVIQRRRPRRLAAPAASLIVSALSLSAPALSSPGRPANRCC